MCTQLLRRSTFRFLQTSPIVGLSRALDGRRADHNGRRLFAWHRSAHESRCCFSLSARLCCCSSVHLRASQAARRVTLRRTTSRTLRRIRTMSQTPSTRRTTSMRATTTLSARRAAKAIGSTMGCATRRAMWRSASTTSSTATTTPPSASKNSTAPTTEAGCRSLWAAASVRRGALNRQTTTSRPR